MREPGRHRLHKPHRIHTISEPPLSTKPAASTAMASNDSASRRTRLRRSHTPTAAAIWDRTTARRWHPISRRCRSTIVGRASKPAAVRHHRRRTRAYRQLVLVGAAKTAGPPRSAPPQPAEPRMHYLRPRRPSSSNATPSRRLRRLPGRTGAAVGRKGRNVAPSRARFPESRHRSLVAPRRRAPWTYAQITWKSSSGLHEVSDSVPDNLESVQHGI